MEISENKTHTLSVNGEETEDAQTKPENLVSYLSAGPRLISLITVYGHR